MTMNATTHWVASTVRATPALIWILMEGHASLVCSVLSSQLTFIIKLINPFTPLNFQVRQQQRT